MVDHPWETGRLQIILQNEITVRAKNRAQKISLIIKYLGH